MPSPQAASVRQSNTAILFMLWGAFFFAIGIYAALMIFILDPANARREGPRPSPMPFLAIFAGIAALIVIITPWVIGVIRRGQESASAREREARGGGEETPEVFLGRAQTLMIIRAAMYESIAIYGLVGNMVFGFTILQGLAFMGLAALMLTTLLPGMIASVEKYNKMKRGDSGAASHFGGGA